MGVKDIAILTKTLYDVQSLKIALAARMRAYSLENKQEYKDTLKELKSREGRCVRILKQELIDGGYGHMLEISGVGPKTVGSLVMYTAKTERICDKKGKYKFTRIHDELKIFPSAVSLRHYAGLHVVCKNCGCVEPICKSKGTTSYMRGDNEHKFTGCGNFVPAAARKLRGKPMDWNDKLRSRLLSIGSSMYRVKGPYRDIFREKRAKAIEKHPDWTKGHTFNYAKRATLVQLLNHFYKLYLRED